MKTKIKVLIFVFLLISVVAFVPVINADATMKEIDMSKLRIIKNKLIDKLGITKYQEIENNVSDIIDSYFIRFNMTGYDLPMMDILKEIAVMIVAMMVLLFGNNPVSLGLGSLLCAVLLSIPVLLMAIVVTTYDLSQIGIEGLNIDKLIEDFGIIGTCLFCIILVPLLAIVLSFTLIISVPIVWITMMQEIVWYAIEQVS